MPWWPIAILAISTLSTSAQNPECLFEVVSGKITIKKERVGSLCPCVFERLKVKNIDNFEWPECLQAKPLVEISIVKTPMDHLPEGITTIKSLKKLSLKFTGISALPDDIANLQSLEELDLRGTEVKTLPSGLGHLKKIDLRMVDLNKNQQASLREQYPRTKIFFSSPCNCN